MYTGTLRKSDTNVEDSTVLIEQLKDEKPLS